MSLGLDLSTDVIQSKLENYYMKGILTTRIEAIDTRLEELRPRSDIDTDAIDIAWLFAPKVQTIPSAYNYPSVVAELGLSAFYLGEYGMAGDFHIDKVEDTEENIEKLDKLEGQFSEEISAPKDLSSYEKSRFSTVITNTAYDNLPPGIKFRLQEMLYQKLINGKLTKLEDVLLSVIRGEFVDLDFEITTEGLKAFETGIEEQLGHIPPSAITQRMSDPTLNLIWYLSSLGIDTMPLTFWGGLSAKDSYSAIDFLDDLSSELRNFPGALAQIFPERLARYSQRMLSIFWERNVDFVGGLKNDLKKDPSFKISDKALNDLKDKIITKIATNSKSGNRKVLSALNLINAYDSGAIDMNTFLTEIRFELGRITSGIDIINKELSILFGMQEDYIKSLMQRIQNPNDEDYNPNFGFSHEKLDYIKEMLSLLIGNDAQQLIQLLDLYRLKNPDLKRYQKQRFTIKNPDFFHEIDSVEKGYWLGFLCADGYHNREQYLTAFELQTGDKDRLVAFSKAIGYELGRIHDRTRLVDIYGKLTWTKMSYMVFSAKPLSNDLVSQGFFDFKEEGNIPHIITQLVDKAYTQSDDLSKTIEGRIALSFLLGFYDGDGSKRGVTGYIASNKREFLLQVKDLFKVPIRNQIYPIKKRVLDSKTGKVEEFLCHGLYLGTDLVSQMMEVFPGSMDRKRTDRKTSKFGDLQFVLPDYYSQDLIDRLTDQGIEFNLAELNAITRNKEGRLIWLDQGTESRGFEHILLRHTEDFKDIFGMYNALDIGNFIFNAIKNKPIHKSFDGGFPGQKLYIYRFGRNYLKIVVADEGFIVTAFPSYNDY
jgi:hypothetical protein